MRIQPLLNPGHIPVSRTEKRVELLRPAQAPTHNSLGRGSNYPVGISCLLGQPKTAEAQAQEEATTSVQQRPGEAKQFQPELLWNEVRSALGEAGGKLDTRIRKYQVEVEGCRILIEDSPSAGHGCHRTKPVPTATAAARFKPSGRVALPPVPAAPSGKLSLPLAEPNRRCEPAGLRFPGIDTPAFSLTRPHAASLAGQASISVNGMAGANGDVNYVSQDASGGDSAEPLPRSVILGRRSPSCRKRSRPPQP